MFNKAVILLGVVVYAGVISALAQDKNDDVIRVETRFVSVPVIVSDRNGRYISGLTAADFAIFQDGVQQKIEFFGATDEPLTVALLIDTSHSTRPVLDDIKDAARSLLKLLGPKDQAMIVTFDHTTNVLVPLTSDQEKLRRGIKEARIPDEIGTTLRDAVYQTVFSSFEGLTGRKAVIVLTDGRDGGSHIGAGKLLVKLQETDTLVYSVQFRTAEKLLIERMLKTGTIPRRTTSRSGSREEQKTEEAAEFMKKLSMVTAGRFYSAEAGELKKTFELIVDELRRQYRLGFYPADSVANTDLHEVKVRVARANLVVRARGSYRSLTKETP